MKRIWLRAATCACLAVALPMPLQAGNGHVSTIVGPYYPWVELDDHRALQVAPWITGGYARDDDAEWRFVDSRAHTSVFFSEKAHIHYATFSTDDPGTIVFVGDEFPGLRCSKDHDSNVPCPSIQVFLSQDGGQHFAHREVRLPPLQYNIVGASYGGGAISANGTADHPIPLVMVRHGVLYLVLGGEARPRIVTDVTRTAHLVSTGEEVDEREVLGVPYVWPDHTAQRWDWTFWKEDARWKAKPAYVFAVPLPEPSASPEQPLSDHPSRTDMVCSWRRMEAQAAKQPELKATQLIGKSLASFGELPAFQLPMKPPYALKPMLAASISERDRAKLLRDMQASDPDWVAAQAPVAWLFPDHFNPPLITTKIIDDDIKCE